MFWRLSMRQDDFRLWIARCNELGLPGERHLEDTIRDAITGRLVELHHLVTSRHDPAQPDRRENNS
jgi:hypothetical protein